MGFTRSDGATLMVQYQGFSIILGDEVCGSNAYFILYSSIYPLPALQNSQMVGLLSVEILTFVMIYFMIYYHFAVKGGGIIKYLSYYHYDDDAPICITPICGLVP